MADAKEAKKREKAEAKAKAKEETKNLKIFFQYIVGVIICLGGFVAGTAIGWSSPANGILKKEGGITDGEFAWISSLFALGAALSQLLVVVLVKCLGLKWCIVVTHVILICGWIPLTLSMNFWVQITGRLVCGIAGAFCVACPMYLGESTHKSHRGTIGVFFQLFITLGILVAYIAGIAKNMIILNVTCGAGCVLAIILMILFIPESPYALLKRNKLEKYEKVMKKLRGKEFDYSKEQAEMQAAIESKESVKEGFKQPVNLKAFGVLLGLHMLQQLSGINAILYHAHAIFSASNTNISEDLSVIIVGIAQVLLCLVAAACVDRAGRIMLFAISVGIMCLCLVLTGFYFMVDKETQETLAMIPTIALVVYIMGFSLGAGPLPWLMFGEYLPSSVKTVMSTIIAFVNWMLAFGTSWVMPVMMASINPAYIFYGFGTICFLGIFYLLLVVVETNQKTFEEIQADIEHHKPGNVFRKRRGA
ncbi:facilitated trehalose transporter Tret1-like [Atheta coriaria]|uniref:facilitated trehalose transporter Tret1-like n=1 Tax=Dalotia coriaria TaxID=877792 RepID=UPI0031F37082